MPDRSLAYFLVFLFIWVGYLLYESEKECDRLFKIAIDQKEVILQYEEAIRSQALYIKLLESRSSNPYNPPESFRQPLHNGPL